MISLILWGIVIYIVYKILNTILRVFLSPGKPGNEGTNIRNYRMKETKYKDVEDVNFTELPNQTPSPAKESDNSGESRRPEDGSRKTEAEVRGWCTDGN